MNKDTVTKAGTVSGAVDVLHGDRFVRVSAKVADSPDFWRWVEQAEHFDALAKDLKAKDLAYSYRGKEAL